jgi:HSP20 family molecular chaperone IbpA
MATPLLQEGDMTRLTGLGHPFFLGFDHLERLADRLTKNGEGFPPYNVEQTGEDLFTITLAVAGFAPEELSVTVEDNQLVLRGKQAGDEQRAYLHRGIAARQFQRAFVLADGLEVEGAELAHGLLSVRLKRPKPDVKVRTIPIRPAGGGGV